MNHFTNTNSKPMSASQVERDLRLFGRTLIGERNFKQEELQVLKGKDLHVFFTVDNRFGDRQPNSFYPEVVNEDMKDYVNLDSEFFSYVDFLESLEYALKEAADDGCEAANVNWTEFYNRNKLVDIEEGGWRCSCATIDDIRQSEIFSDRIRKQKIELLYWTEGQYDSILYASFDGKKWHQVYDWYDHLDEVKTGKNLMRSAFPSHFINTKDVPSYSLRSSGKWWHATIELDPYKYKYILSQVHQTIKRPKF